MLEKAQHQNALIAADNIFRAIAMVDIKVNDGHPLQAVPL